MTPRRARLAALPFLLLASCYTFEPVHERLEIAVLPAGIARVTAETRIDVSSAEPGPNPSALERRLARLRSDLASGQDAWSRALTPERSRTLEITHAWDGGQLSRARHVAEIEVERLPDLFRGTDVDAWIDRGEGWAELNLAPLAPSRATREQRQAVQEALRAFANAHALYVERLGSLYAFLDAHPERAEDCFDALMGGLAEPDRGTDDEERRVVQQAHEAMFALGDFFAIESGRDGYSIDALVRLVHDPLPAEISVVVPDLLESEGFMPGDNGRLTLPARSLWTALSALEGRWVSPDAAVIALRAIMADEEPDLVPLADEPRRHEAAAPASDEILALLREQLGPVGIARARWATAEE